MFHRTTKSRNANPWNKSLLIGQKSPLSMQEIWVTRMRLQDREQLRELALFNLALDSKLRAVQLFLGHSSLDSTVRYLGIEIDDALEMSERVDI